MHDHEREVREHVVKHELHGQEERLCHLVGVISCEVDPLPFNHEEDENYSHNKCQHKDALADKKLLPFFVQIVLEILSNYVVEHGEDDDARQASHCEEKGCLDCIEMSISSIFVNDCSLHCRSDAHDEDECRNGQKHILGYLFAPFIHLEL